jgi:WD40 repeat protein
MSAGSSGLWISNPATGTSDRLIEGTYGQFAVSEDGRRIALIELPKLRWSESGRVALLDLDSGTRAYLESHGDQVHSVALDPTGTMIVTGDREGIVRVGPASGGEPQLLLGHEHSVWSVDIDPGGGWIASGGQDRTVRIWPMPDLSKPPLHTLPRDELIAKLRTLTNLRVARDAQSNTGWSLSLDPFPGWETTPTW